ncbi:MAG: HAD family hydrolase [Bacteroides sp.]|nr:HAD family hydrolase [Bacteroides sp.]MCM1549590.1 HAD family hydrolase [Clostridium sp.]
MRQGILFDLDGTLWDSSRQVVESWNEVLAQQPDVKRQITIEDMQGFMGLPMDEIGRRCFQGQGLTEVRIREIMKACEEHENDYIRQHGGILFPDLTEVLQDLSGDYFLAVVSNCQVGYIEAFLEYHQLSEYFADFESFGNTGLQKGDNIRLVCDRNQLTQAVYLGDIQKDYEAAVQAGIPFILAGYGFGEVDADVPVIESLRELRSTVERVFSDKKNPS